MPKPNMRTVYTVMQVSCTVTFDPEREGPQLIQALEYYQYQLKGAAASAKVVDLACSVGSLCLFYPGRGRGQA